MRVVSQFKPRFMMWNPETGHSIEPLTTDQWEELVDKGYEWLRDLRS